MVFINYLSSVEDYAKLCGVAEHTIFYRHYHGKISSVKIDGHVFVDTRFSPPKKFISKHEKKVISHASLPGGISANDLVSIRSYSGRKNIRSAMFYEMAITDKIQSFVIGGTVFMLKAEADSVPKNKRRNRKR